HRVVDRRVQVQVVDLAGGTQPVRVDVHERHPPAAVYPGDDERRRGDLTGYVESGADALCQRGLPGAERPAQQHQVTRSQDTTQRPAEVPGVLDRRQSHTSAFWFAPRGASLRPTALTPAPSRRRRGRRAGPPSG